MPDQSAYKVSFFRWLMVLVAIMLFTRLNAPPIYILDEAKNAQCAREMLQRHDFIVPTFNGQLRTDKPALHYFFMMAAYKVFGINAFAARFFSAVMGLLTLLVTYIYGKKLLNPFAAFCAILVLGVSTHFLFEFRLAVPDPYLIFFMTLGLFSGFSWMQQNKASQLFIAATALALAALAKGPVALVLPGVCFLVWMAWKKKWAVVFTWKLLPAAALFCAIALPWYWAVHKATNGAWTRGFFINNNLNRFSDPQEGHGGFFLLPLVFLSIGLIPFVVFLGETIKQRKAVFQQELVQFAGMVVVVFIIFFSISSTKLPNYIMPCYPFAAIVLGNYIAALVNNEYNSKLYPLYILLGFLLLIPIAGYFAISHEAEAADLKNIAWLLLIPAVLFIITLFLFPKSNWCYKISGICIAFTLFNMLGLFYIYPALYSQNPVAKTITMVKQYPVIYAYKAYNPGYNFYLNQNIPVYKTIDSLRFALQQPSAIVISRKEFADSLNILNLKLIASRHDLFELPETIILKQYARP